MYLPCFPIRNPHETQSLASGSFLFCIISSHQPRLPILFCRPRKSYLVTKRHAIELLQPFSIFCLFGPGACTSPSSAECSQLMITRFNQLLASKREIPAAQRLSKVNNVVMIFLLIISKYADDRWWRRKVRPHLA